MKKTNILEYTFILKLKFCRYEIPFGEGSRKYSLKCARIEKECVCLIMTIFPGRIWWTLVGQATKAHTASLVYWQTKIIQEAVTIRNHSTNREVLSSTHVRSCRCCPSHCPSSALDFKSVNSFAEIVLPSSNSSILLLGSFLLLSLVPRSRGTVATISAIRSL
jgi:hypothetical protein